MPIFHKKQNRFLSYFLPIQVLIIGVLLYHQVQKKVAHATVFSAMQSTFKSVEQSIVTHIDQTFSAFEKKMDKERRGEEFLDAAKAAQTIAAEYQYALGGLFVEVFRYEIPQHTGAFAHFLKKYVFPKQIVPQIEQHAFQELKNLQTQFEDLFTGSAFDTTDQAALRNSLFLEKYKPLPPPAFSFLGTEATQCLLQHLSTERRIMESSTVDQLFGKVGGCCICFDAHQVAVIPNRSRLQLGETFVADIYLAQTASMSKPVIRVNNQTLSLDAYGVANYSASSNILGEKILRGYIAFKIDSENTVQLPFEQRYVVVPACD